jgi:3',5'-cyclic AMP phosphodiesterase CpdA
MAGDVAEDGRTQHAKAAAALIAGRTPAVDAVVLLGDNARYDPLKLMTVLSYYNKYYKPESEGNWGQFDSISFPQMGNHEYMSLNPQGYIDYFQTRMTAIKALPDYSGFIDDKARGYYSFDLGGWHFVSLNANCTGVSGGCKAGSAQEQWLKADLEAHPNQPIIAGFHNPRWACGGSHASDEAMQPFWADLYDAGADFVFVGHDHYYQRWKPLDKTSPEAAIDTANGLTEIVVGSYGVSPYDVCDPAEPRVSEQAGGEAGMGVFFLKLGSDGSYAFEYVLRSDGSIFDSGAGMSHHAP